MTPRLPVGTRIRFVKALEAGPNEDHPAIIYALQGEYGTITGHNAFEGYWARTDRWPNSFGAGPDEFEVVP